MSVCAMDRFINCQGFEEIDPIEKLRFFCSLAMEDQDWIDVEQFFDEVVAERDYLKGKSIVTD